MFTFYRGCIYDCSNAVYSFQLAYHSNTYRIFVTTAKPSKTLVGTHAEKEIVVKSSCIITNSLVGTQLVWLGYPAKIGIPVTY